MDYSEPDDAHSGIISINNYQDAMVTLDDGTKLSINDNTSINRAWHGDRVLVKDDHIVNILHTDRHNMKIPGFIRCDDKQKYGINKKGMPIYMFVPLSSHYPRMMVASSAGKKYKSTVYVLVSYLEWKSDQQYPRGNCEDIIGPCDSDSASAVAYAHHHQLMHDYTTFPRNLEYKIPTNSADRRDLRDEYIFSIDPANCIDIDDAIHIKQLGNDEFEIGVHISDVTYFVVPGSDIDMEARKRAFTIYLPHKQIPIIPECLSHDICSLHPNKERYTLSCLMIFQGDQMKSAVFQPTIICSKAAFSYDEVDAGKVPSIAHTCIRKLEEITKTHNNSHKLVEVLMLWTNEQAAKFMHKNCINALFRVQNNTATSSIVTQSQWVNSLLANSDSPAMYQLIHPNRETMLRHHGIGVDMYTHFTSPIRRYADQIVHRMILGTWNDTCDIEYLNQKQKDHKKFQRDMNILTTIPKVAKMNCHLTGIIMPFRYSTKYKQYKVDIALPELGIVVPMRLHSHKTSYLLHVSIDAGNMRIENVHTNKCACLSEGSEIRVHICIQPEEPILHKKFTLVNEKLKDLLQL